MRKEFAERAGRRPLQLVIETTFEFHGSWTLLGGKVEPGERRVQVGHPTAFLRQLIAQALSE